MNRYPIKCSYFRSILLFAVVGVTSFSAANAGVVVEDAYIRGLPPGQQVTAAFFRLTNQSQQACALLGASTPVSGNAEIHAHSHQNGMMRMRRLEQVVLPVGETVAFKPGGFHLMLFGVQQPLVDGDSHTVTLFFKGCSEQTVTAEVRSVLR